MQLVRIKRLIVFLHCRPKRSAWYQVPGNQPIGVLVVILNCLDTQKRQPKNQCEHESNYLRPLLTHLCEVKDRKSTRLNSSHSQISYAVFCLKKKKTANE